MSSVVLLMLFWSCREAKVAEEDTQGWWESETKSDEEDKDEFTEDGEDKDFEEVNDCPEDFNPQESCEGSWETTICTYEGTIWWCQDGVWLNEEDK